MGRRLLTFSYYLGIAALFRFMHRRELTILLYHGVSPQRDAGIFNYRGKFIDPRHFEIQMRYFKKRYAILDLDEAIEKLDKGTLPPRALAVTFDDGYRNFYTHAFPILKRLDIPATMFLATDFVLDKKPLWVDRLEYAIGKQAGARPEKNRLDAQLRDELKKIPSDAREIRLRSLEEGSGVHFDDFYGDRSAYESLNEQEIQEMAHSKITFGAHTKSHPILPLETNDRINEEIRGSKDALSARNIALSSVFAYPNGQPGDWNDAVVDAVDAAGFTAALTTIEGTNTKSTHPFQLRRMVMDATGDDHAFAAIASGVRLFLKYLKNYARHTK